MNRLAKETSPYLLQHQENPVDWYPWGAEAFAKAKAEDKPILLSVGYSACHWCHVMAHESFEDEATAALMNQHFVNVKVDREERPDVDSIYMSAVQAMTGQGGWPMTVVMTPEAKPFFGGTYFPKLERYGQPSFSRVLSSLADAWQNRRAEVLESAQKMTQYLAALSKVPAQNNELSNAVLQEALLKLSRNFDEQEGGFGAAPKFPPHSVLKFLLRQSEPGARLMAEKTLKKMAFGGIYDQIGGGFARYSVDDIWLVPHFEKMLYDNAQLVQRYTEAYQLTQNPLYKRIIEETLAWVCREMSSPEGGFYSALDADSEGEEGKFYVWSETEVNQLLHNEAELAKAYFDISKGGNFEGHNILNIKQNPEAVARQFNLSSIELSERIARIKSSLLEARAKRIRPGLDDKILTSWNALMLAAFADAGRILARPDYIDIARKNAEFIRDNLYQAGRLKHSYKAGHAKIEGLLEDYAYFGLALLALYRATFEADWLELAFELAETIIKHFYDAENGGFFSTADDAEALIVRPKNHFDSPNPSENAATAELLIALARYAAKPDWEELALTAIQPMLEGVAKHPTGFGSLLCALEFHLSPPREIAIFGTLKEAGEVLDEIDSYALPYTVIALAESEASAIVSSLPFMQSRGKRNGKATVYVCEAGSCQLPVTEVADLRPLLLAQLSR